LVCILSLLLQLFYEVPIARQRSPSLDDGIGSWEANSPSSSDGVPLAQPLTQFTPPDGAVGRPPVAGLSFQHSEGVLPSPPPSADRSQLSDYDYGSRQGSHQDGFSRQGSHHRRLSHEDGSHHQGSHRTSHQGSQQGYFSNSWSYHPTHNGSYEDGSHHSRHGSDHRSHHVSHQGPHRSHHVSHQGSHQDGSHHSRSSSGSNSNRNRRVSFEPMQQQQQQAPPRRRRPPPPPPSFLRTPANGYHHQYDSNHTNHHGVHDHLHDHRPHVGMNPYDLPTNYYSSSVSSTSRSNHHQQQPPQNYDTDYHTSGSNRPSSDSYSHHSYDERNGGY
jgi:hypothetical protein